MKLQNPVGKKRGFTLVELLIALAILGILVGVAVPSYNQYIMKSHRTDAINSLTDLSLRLEQRYTTLNSYAEATIAANNAQTDVLDSATSAEGRYTLSIDSATDAAFSITATPIGPQAKDYVCKKFTLSNLGIKSVSGTGDQSECW